MLFYTHCRNQRFSHLITEFDLGDAINKVLLIEDKEHKKNFMVPFCGWGSTASKLEPLCGGSLLFTS